jgi:hypothetical protein
VNTITAVLKTGLARGARALLLTCATAICIHIIAIIDPVACDFTCGTRNAVSRMALARNGGEILRRDEEAR